MEYKYNKKELNLTQLITEAGIGNIGLKIKGDDMFFIFENPLSSANKTKLDIAVENHIPEAVIEPIPTSAEEKLNQIQAILNK